MSLKLILYSKPGCHLCEGLEEKLQQILEMPDFASVELEIRDITTREDWLQAFQYEVPVLCKRQSQAQTIVEEQLPRPSPRATVQQVAQMLQKYLTI